MEDLQDKIIELMDLFDDEQVTTADKIDRPQRALERQAIDDFMDRNPMAGGGMLVQPSADGSRPGYNGLPDGIKKTPAGNYKAVGKRSGKNLNITKKSLKEAKAALAEFKKNNPVKKRTTETTKISGDRLKVLNQYAQDLHGLNYKDLGPGQVQEVYNTARNRGFEYRLSGQDAFPTEQKNKLIEFAKENNIKLDFNKYPKYGVSKGPNNKINPNYTKLVNFKKRGFKNKEKDLLSEADRIKVMDNFELPKGVKNWNFDNNKFGIPYTGNENISKRIANKLKEKKKYKVAADYSTPKGWMVASMNRVYENEIKNKVKPKDLTYQPIKNNKGIIVGFKDNTEAGGGEKYYSIKKYQDEFGDGTAWAAHGDHERVKKFLNIAKGAQVDDPSKLLQKILDDKGITKLLGENRPLRLNDILTHERYFDKLSTTAPKKLIERQIVLHHTKGVNPSFGNAAATKDLQLLSGVINQKVKGLEKFAKERKLTQNEITQLKNYGAKITDFDGKIVGGGFLDPERQFKTIEKGAIDYAKSDQFNVKTVASYLERLGCGKAAGGRVFYNEGAFGLTKCAEKGRLKLENIVTKGASNADDAILAKTILKAGGGLKSAFALRNIFGPAAIAATVAFEGGLIGYDMLTSGKTLREAFGDNLLNYALGKDYQIDPQEEMFKRFKGLGYDDQQIGGIKKALDAMNTINTGAQLAMDVGQQQEALQKSRGQTEEFMIPDDQMMADTAGQRAEQNLKDAQERLTAFNQSLEAVDRPGGMKKEDVLSEYFSSGKYAEDLDLFNQAKKEANIQKLESALPTAFGKVFPKFEERRQEGLADLRSVINPAFNIPGARDATFIPGKTVGGLFGLAEGGRAGYKLGKIIKPKPSKVRSDAKSIIDENIKLMKQMKETGEIDEISSDLNQVIKKALDEDFFDKKDRIIDNLNARIAKAKEKGLDSEEIGKGQIEFYDNIIKSNFRTKTGPFFDYQKRKNKAGGGLLKQAGDRSGPPPESGPNPQGLQGLLNRVKKI